MKKQTTKTTKKDVKVLSTFIAIDHGDVESTSTDLVNCICDGEFYCDESPSKLLDLAEEGDVEEEQDVYQLTFKKVGKITNKKREFVKV